MNTVTVSLTSSLTDYMRVLPTLVMDDHTKLTLNLEGLTEKVIPVYLKIDWGDGTSETHNNNIYNTARLEQNALVFNPIFAEYKTKEYYPSETCLYKCLTAQVFVNYANGDNNWHLIPIKIRTYDYFESIYDLKLDNTSILPTELNPKTHQFITKMGRVAIEMSGS